MSERRRWKTWHVIVAALVAFTIGVGVGGASADDDTTVGKTAATVTNNSLTARETTTTAEGRYVPAPADFVLTVVTTEQSCFGSAGCNVTYQIDVAYNGPRPLDEDDTWVLIYEVRGGEDMKVGNITVKGEQYSRDTDMVSTGTGPRLEAIVTAVRER